MQEDAGDSWRLAATPGGLFRLGHRLPTSIGWNSWEILPRVFIPWKISMEHNSSWRFGSVCFPFFFMGWNCRWTSLQSYHGALSNNTPSDLIQEDKVKKPKDGDVFFCAAAASAQVWPGILACCAVPWDLSQLMLQTLGIFWSAQQKPDANIYIADVG